MIRQSLLRYTEGPDEFHGQLVQDTSGMDETDQTGPAPGILISPAFGGLGEFEIARAHDLAAAGYIVLAVDYYGNGQRAAGVPEAMALMQTLTADRPRLARRMNAALAALKSVPGVDSARIGAMGYCLGGKTILDLARSGANFQAGVCLHGLYDPPAEPASQIIPALLMLHGWDDPLATPADLTGLAAELDPICSDWQVQAFGHTGHSFTNPVADDPDRGLAYSEVAATRSWRSLTDFFKEMLMDKPPG